MQCKSLWIKASAKCINVNVNVTQWVGLGLWSRYAYENCVLYAPQTHANHVHAKVNFCVSKAQVYILNW